MQISANGIAIEVEDLGKPTGEPLLLIMGLGMQLTAWHRGLVQQMLDQGFRVIRFDNRDVGLSQNFDGLGAPNLALAALQRLAHWPVRSAYSLSDMADDAAGVLTALGLKSAHVCGASMGGMIAQQLALNHPERVRSLTLMMTDSGARGLPRPTLKVSAALLARPADPYDLDSLVDHYYRLFRLIGSPAYPGPEAWLRQVCADAVRRSNRPQGFARQLMAIAADTGPGVPERTRAHLFEAFQTSGRPGGSGLGLAIAAELVRAHGGDIHLVEGTIGATFRIVIPDRPVELLSIRNERARA